MRRDGPHQEAPILPLPQLLFKNWPRHPPCITSLLSYGAPGDLGETDVNDLLVAYVVTKGLSGTQGEKLVQKMAQSAVPVNFAAINTMQMTTKAQMLQQFKDCLAVARGNDGAYRWDCKRLWASDELKSEAHVRGGLVRCI